MNPELFDPLEPLKLALENNIEVALVYAGAALGAAFLLAVGRVLGRRR